MPIYNGKFQKSYNLKKDHAEIKKQIKGWELTLDDVLKKYNDGDCDPITISNFMRDIEQMSQEMMSINI